MAFVIYYRCVRYLFYQITRKTRRTTTATERDVAAGIVTVKRGKRQDTAGMHTCQSRVYYRSMELFIEVRSSLTRHTKLLETSH